MSTKAKSCPDPRAVALGVAQEECIALMLDHVTGFCPDRRYKPNGTLVSRLAKARWIIVDRVVGRKGENRWVLVPLAHWLSGSEPEAARWGGMAGEAQGLTRKVANRFYLDRRSRALEGGPVPPVSYAPLIAMSRASLNVLEELLDSEPMLSLTMDFDSAIEVAKAAASQPSR